jgi:hypothetical protein
MNNTEHLLQTAFRKLLDPGASWDDFNAALAILEQDKGWMVTALDECAGHIVADFAPDRMSHLARALPRDAPMPALTQASLEAFRVDRERCHTSPGILPLRRAHAFAVVLSKIGGFQQLAEDDLVWLFDWDEYSVPLFYESLAAWCEARDPLPSTVVELVRRLREEEVDSPILDRLAAWVTPSVQGMSDLAGWENGARRCFEPAWREAVSRWSEGARVGSPKPIPWRSGPLGSPGPAPVTSRSVRDNLRT